VTVSAREIRLNESRATSGRGIFIMPAG